MQKISSETIIQAKENVLLGITNSSKTYNHKEKEIVSTHAAAKIIISQVKNTHFLSSVSLIPRSYDKILTLFAKEQTPNILLKETLIQEITVLLAGKSAEEVICETTIDKVCSDFVEAFHKSQELTRFFGYNSISVKDKEDLQRDILKKCFSDAKALVKLNEPLIKELSQKLQEQNITPMPQIKEFLQNKQIKDMKEIKIQPFQPAKGFNKTTIWHFICTLLFVLFLLLSTILIFKTIYWLFAIPKNYFIFKKKIITPFLIVVSLMFSILLFSFDCYHHLPFINATSNITVSDLLNKIDNYETKKITYFAKNSWLEGFYYHIKLIDKNGVPFYCKLKPISQNILEQKIASLKYKDFISQEEKYFDWVNLLIKIILSLSSFVFLLYGCLNIKRIRKQFSNEQISKKI